MESNFPFKTHLSLKPMIDFIRSLAADNDSMRSELARILIDRIDEVPVLSAPKLDPELLESHRDIVYGIFDIVLPWSLSEEIQVGVTGPYDLNVIYQTKEFERLKLFDQIRADWENEGSLMETGRIMNAYHQILEHLYGVEKEFSYSAVINAPDEQIGLDRAFKVILDTRFISVRQNGKPIDLNPHSIDELHEERMNLDIWHELLPPDKFTFTGVMIIKAFEVTDQHMLSLLREDLLHRDALSTGEKFDRLQQRIQSLMKRPQLSIGLFTIEKGEDIGEADGVRPVTRSLMFGTADKLTDTEDFDSESFRKLLHTGEMVIINDLHDISCEGEEKKLAEKGIRNLVLVPLIYQDEIIGVLELGSPVPGDVHFMNALKLHGLGSLFATTLRRFFEERENYIQAVIKEHYTAIHPSVEWRFREAARRWMKRRKAGLRVKPEHIVFNDVYSLYGLSDIRGSSTERNQAIQADLLDQLHLANEVINAASSGHPMPALDEVGYRIVKAISQVEQDLHSGDDFRILEFLTKEVELLFPQLDSFGPEVLEAISRYRSALDPRLGFVYRERKDYEESVMLINDVISTYIERQEEKAQQQFPHYFEKFKTDGVDYNLYVGASLQQNGLFDPLYLHNLRLWQLRMTCGIAYELQSIRDELKKPLEVAHLILVQDIPISIRFRIDEKKFDVDGAYNIRYEIVKKRIDKAEVKGTDERLTMPNKIAIVYSQDKEAEEYRRYIEFFQASGYLEKEVEDLELEDLQGVHGLRALRVSINLAKEENGAGNNGKQLRDHVDISKVKAA